jgi:hypothetical protein
VKPTPPDWRLIYRRILHGGTGYNTIEKIEAMTMAEIAMVLDDDFDRPSLPMGFRPMSGAEQQRYNEWWMSLTPRGRLEAYRRNEV